MIGVMIILGIETSCDDTCVAIVEVKGQKKPKFRILSNIVSSQVEIHRKYGGVYPTLAKRAHEKNLPLVLKQALEGAKLLPKDIDAVAVTVGPGLEPCLWVGVNFAKNLAKKWKKPIIPVNHIESHILANWLKISEKLSRIKFPAICLVVSGGHTQIILMKGVGKYKILCETRDDAAGECFDKTARILGLPYPGGPAIAAEAAKSGREQFSATLPRPMIYQKNYDFSFSGLKTAVLYHSKQTKKTKKYIQQMASEIQQAIIDVLVRKTIKAAKDFKVKTIILGGGVTANNELRKQFKEKIKKDIPNIQYLTPNIQFCTDNAAMTAVAGYYNKNQATKNWKDIKANANIKL